MQGTLRDRQGPPPALLPLLRTPFQGELLAWLYLHPQEEASLSEIASRFGVSTATASREADRLVEAELIIARRHGNLRLLRANTEGRLSPGRWREPGADPFLTSVRSRPMVRLAAPERNSGG
ncbi:MarR family transcriptional regulator [Streptomyces sp. MCAF7]